MNIQPQDARGFLFALQRGVLPQIVRLEALMGLRFVLHTLFNAVVLAAMGFALVYLSLHSWQSGEFHTRGSVLHAETSPIQFYLVIGSGALFGTALLLVAPFLAFKVFASSADKARIQAQNPKLYGPVRSSLLITFVLLGIAMLVAWKMR
jgi:hypothetical protein